MVQQQTKYFVKSVDLSAVSLAGATLFSYHAGFSRFLDSVQIWSYLAKLCLKPVKIELQVFHRRAAKNAEMIDLISLPLTPVK